MDGLAQKAIDEALKGNWEEALSLNKQILKQTPEDEEALNRLARANFEIGNLKQAVSCYKKALKLDPYNTIAKKALLRFGKMKETRVKPKKKKTPAGDNGSALSLADIFIEEPGKTKTVPLIHLGDESIIGILAMGEEVKLIPHAHRVSAQTQEGNYIGRLPDDLSRRIIKLTRAGNQYRSLVKSVFPQAVKIFIREIKQGPHIGNIPSFPANDKLGYTAFGSKPGQQAGSDSEEEGNF